MYKRHFGGHQQPDLDVGQVSVADLLGRRKRAGCRPRSRVQTACLREARRCMEKVSLRLEGWGQARL